MGYEQLGSFRAFKRKKLTVEGLRFLKSEDSVGDTRHALEDINPQHSSTEQQRVIKQADVMDSSFSQSRVEGLPLLSTPTKSSVILNKNVFERKLSLRHNSIDLSHLVM